MDHELDARFDKARQWHEEAKALRKVLLGCDLTEEKKWYQPCYTHDGWNIAIIGRMKDHLTLSFFAGALLKDPQGVLEWPGPNSRQGKVLRLTSSAQVEKLAPVIEAYVAEAIGNAKAGRKVEPAAAPDRSEELERKLEEDAKYRRAFDALTPGRQRSWCLHFSSAKQAATREVRIDRARERILAGKGWNER